MFFGGCQLNNLCFSWLDRSYHPEYYDFVKGLKNGQKLAKYNSNYQRLLADDYIKNAFGIRRNKPPLLALIRNVVPLNYLVSYII
jgi:hypothetical protein